MIRNFIFDFGGVLLDIDMQRSYEELSKLTGKNLDYPHVPKEIRDIVFRFETGNLGIENFIWHLQHQCAEPKPQGLDIIMAWNAMLLGWDNRKFKFLTELRGKYKVYLLSNTNALHLDWVHQDLKKKHGISDFEKRFFDKAYYSFEIGLHKPDPEIYRHVLNDAGLDPDETIFIDDALVNVQAAVRLGMHVYHHDPHKDLLTVFEKHGWL